MTVFFYRMIWERNQTLAGVSSALRCQQTRKQDTNGSKSDGACQAMRLLTKKSKRHRERQTGDLASFAIVLETILGTSAEMWVRMQAEYDLWEARLKAA